MTTRNTALFLGVALAVLSNPGFSWANDASVSFFGGSPRLQDEQEVTLVSEHLVFSHRPSSETLPADGNRCDTNGVGELGLGSCDAGWCSTYSGMCVVQEHWQAELTYVLQNVGTEDRQLQIGLPFLMPDAEWEHMGPSADDDIQGFETLLDGATAEVQRHDEHVTDEATDIEFNRLYVTPVDLAAGQTRTLTHRYTSFLSVASSDATNEFYYLLRTGRGWAGPIGDVRIDLELPPDANPCLLSTLPFSQDGRWLRVHLTSWTPGRDFKVLWVNRDAVFDVTEPGWMPDDDRIENICNDVMSQPTEAQQLFADHVDLLYGASPHGKRAAASAEGPLRWCSAHYTFAHQLTQPQWAAPASDMPNDINYIAESTYPESMPSAVRACVTQIRAGH